MFAQRTKNLNSSFIRDILAVTQQPHIISFAGGLPDPALFPAGELQLAAERMHQQLGNSLYQYSETAGLPPLREYIAEHLTIADCQADEIIITTGSQQGLDLVVRCLIDPGQKVVVEAPTYLGALQVLRANQAELITIPSDDQGPDLHALEEIVKKEPIRFFYTVTDFQNPTGTSYSRERRERLVALAKKYDFLILEDAPYAALRYSGEALPSLHTLMPNRVIRFGSFSKIIAPALRLGWINAPREVIKVVEKLKQAADLHSSGYDQHLVLEYLKSGALKPHLQKIRAAYGDRLDAMASALSRYLPDQVQFTKPEGGMFIWATLTHHESTLELFNSAIEQGVAFVPGEAFYANGESNISMRLNFSNSQLDKIEEGVKRLARLINQHDPVKLSATA
ncbi:MAG: PLP-dependent aminotransferase family protein [Sedimenticola sp.]|nr:PLP-dependent aminotransferase family protein [Sedimenticola sp.]MCW8975710.1 PLP-dependent aminotransferase family protein [Sedimenticola sp.]